jgi:DNA-binding NarL/FixJ family response regulator
MSIRLVLVDDQPLVRAGLRTLLSTVTDIDVVGEATNGAEAVEVVERLVPNAVLMDVRMPGLDGLEATKMILSSPSLAAVWVVMLTTFDVEEYVYEALAAEASGFLLKDAEPDEIIRAVRAAATGDAVLSPSVTGRIIADYALASGSRASQRGDRGRPSCEPADGQDIRDPCSCQTGCPRPGAVGSAGLRARPRSAGRIVGEWLLEPSRHRAQPVFWALPVSRRARSILHGKYVKCILAADDLSQAPLLAFL